VRGESLGRFDAIRTGGERRSLRGILVMSRLKVGREVPPLRTARLVRELERSWREACERERFRLVHYSIQNDHVHMIVEASSARDLACGLKEVAARFARGVNRVFRRAGRVLADRCYVHVLRTPREVRNAIA